MRCQHQPRRPHGVFLVELIACLPIMAAVAMIVTEMVNTSLKMVAETRVRDTMIHRVDTALNTLRRDAWRAASIQAIGDQVAFVEPDGVVLWRMEPGGKLTRIVPVELPAKTTWIEMPGFSFTAAGPLLTVDVESAPGAAKHEHTTLVSQRMLRGGGP